MKTYPFSFTKLMLFKYNDVVKHHYDEFYQQEQDGTITRSDRHKCFDFSDKTSRARFYADPESGLCVRLAECDGILESVCFAPQAAFSRRKANGKEVSEVYSLEEMHDADDGEDTANILDPSVNIEIDTEEDAYLAWLESQLSVDERGLFRAVLAGYKVNDYAKLIAVKNPDLKPNSVWRKYSRMMDKLIVKAERLRSEWNKL